ncbi:MAG: SPASM domain-containing protein [Ruminococcus sp.]|nr:SPASM domain-containing protein [Ruminococcus sp.]
MKELYKQREKIYIYGAGLYGQRVYKLLRENELPVQGFIVSSDSQCNKKIFDLKVQYVKDMDLKEAGIIIGANRRNSLEILDVLHRMNVCEDRIICACEYLDKREIDKKYYQLPSVEITTVIGCKVNCQYCPQPRLLKNYFRDDPDRESVMSMDTFTACLEHLPKECHMMFCGMAEPFLNPMCVEMIEQAYRSGRDIELYTTLVGITEKDFEKILTIPVNYVNIHAADRNGYADIPVTENYFKLFKTIINHRREDGKMFVNACNTQGEPHPRIKELCNGKIDISTILHDRAGNLEGEALISKRNSAGILSCTLCGQDLNHNVLLPDGTLLLCCMDYGMKHVLGNLKDETYEEIMSGDRIAKIKEGLMGNTEIEILCRNCSNAVKIGD